MEREDDYDLQERKERVSAVTPGEEMGNEDFAAGEKTLFTTDAKAKIWLGEKKKSAKTEFVSYTHVLWPYLVVIVFLFFGSLLTGYISAASFPSMAEALMKNFSTHFGSLLTMSPLYIMFMIFLNNAFVSLVSLVLGLALGVFPILFIASNGYLVGVISYVVSQQKGFLFILLALLPHGLIELPMVFMSASIGLRLGYHVFLHLIGRPAGLKGEFKQGLSFYFRWIMPLLFVAAMVETFITPLILSLINES